MENNVVLKQDFVFYEAEDGKVKVAAMVDEQNDTIWMTQKAMSELFNVNVPAISKHLKNIFESGELSENTAVSKMETLVNKGFMGESVDSMRLYNLDAIIAVGYRVNSYQATKFRQWATSVLKDYMIKGFALDDERLKQGGKLFGKDRIKELIERIREIRASERVFYEKITDIFKDCSIDYDPCSPISQEFYAKMQNKFHYAIHQHTAAELLMRANAEAPYMNLTSWKRQGVGGKIYKSDVTVGKNYLSEDEIRALNRLVNMFLDYAENQAEKGKGTYRMEDWAKRLDMFLNFNEYPILTDKGSVSAEIARRFAESEYSKFRVRQDIEYKSDFNRLIEESQQVK